MEPLEAQLAELNAFVGKKVLLKDTARESFQEAYLFAAGKETCDMVWKGSPLAQSYVIGCVAIAPPFTFDHQDPSAPKLE